MTTNSFSFDAWIAENNLAEIKSLFVKYGATTIATLHLRSEQLHAVMTDKEILKNHVSKIPLIMIAIQSCYKHLSSSAAVSPTNDTSAKAVAKPKSMKSNQVYVAASTKASRTPLKINSIGISKGTASRGSDEEPAAGDNKASTAAKDERPMKASKQSKAKKGSEADGPVCRFWGSVIGCKEGSTCKFSHANRNAVPRCMYWQPSWDAGCKWGVNCKFRHVDYSGKGDEPIVEWRKLITKAKVVDKYPEPWPPVKPDAKAKKVAAKSDEAKKIAKSDEESEELEELIMLD